MIDPREEFKNIVRELAQEETKNILQNEDIFRNIMGTVVRVGENNKYDVDIVTTTLKNIVNQSGVRLKIGDSVMIAEKCGSNYANCYISTKAGVNENTLDDVFDGINNSSSSLAALEKRISNLEAQLNGITFARQTNSKLKATIPYDGSTLTRYIALTTS